MSKNAENMCERVRGSSFLARVREGEEGIKDEWRKRDHLPLCLSLDDVIFRCERERVEISSSSPLTWAEARMEEKYEEMGGNPLLLSVMCAHAHAREREEK